MRNYKGWYINLLMFIIGSYFSSCSMRAMASSREMLPASSASRTLPMAVAWPFACVLGANCSSGAVGTAEKFGVRDGVNVASGSGFGARAVAGCMGLVRLAKIPLWMLVQR